METRTAGKQTYFQINHDHLEIQQQAVSNGQIQLKYRLWSYQGERWGVEEAIMLIDTLRHLFTGFPGFENIHGSWGSFTVRAGDEAEAVDALFKHFDLYVA